MYVFRVEHNTGDCKDIIPVLSPICMIAEMTWILPVAVPIFFCHLPILRYKWNTSMNKWSFISHFQIKMTHLRRKKRGFVKYLHKQADVLASAFKHFTEEGWFADMFLKRGIHQTTPP